MTSQSKPLLICVVGPTAIGKTRMAISLAKHFNTEIVSADSRQFYKEMCIGTAVPSSEELEEATHHFIQHKSIEEPYSVGQFEKDALNKLSQLFKLHKCVVLVGGSGLYVDAVTKGLDDFPMVDPKHRDVLNKQLQEKGLELLQKELQQADPLYAQKVDMQNPHRVIRALEIYRETGNPYSHYLTAPKKERPFTAIYIGLKAPREIVYSQINQRVDQMMDQGLVNEVRALAPYKDLNALMTVGYRELFEFLEDQCTLKQAVENIKRNTRRFAKRQETWFKKNPEINWFEHTREPKKIIAFLENHASIATKVD